MKNIYKILLFFTISYVSLAHPHVFFDVSYNLSLEKLNIKKLEITLFIDEMNTILLTQDVGDKKDIKKEELEFYEDLLRDIHIKYNQKNYKVDFVKSFVDDDEMLAIKVESKINAKALENQKLIFSIYDTEYFYNYEYDKNSLKIETINFDKTYDYSCKENKSKAFYFDMIYPYEFEVIFK